MSLLNNMIQHLQRGCGRKILPFYLLSVFAFFFSPSDGLCGLPLQKQRCHFRQGEVKQWLIRHGSLRQIRQRIVTALSILYGGESVPEGPGLLLYSFGRTSTLLGVDAKFCSWLGWDERRVSKEPENEESRPGLVPKSSLPWVRLKISSLMVSWKKTLEKLTENEGMIKLF